MQRILRNLIIVLCTSALATAAGQAFAQTAQFRGGNQQGVVAVIQSLHDRALELNLTDDQRTRIEQLFTQTAQDARQLRNDLIGADPQERVQRVSQFLSDTWKSLGTILTPDQLEKLRQGAATQPALGAGGMYLQRIRAGLQTLDLTADQRQQIRALFQQMQTRMQTLRQQMQSGQDISADVTKLSDDLRQNLSTILTADEQSQLRDYLQKQGLPPGAAMPMLKNPPNPAAAAAPPAKSGKAGLDGLTDSGATPGNPAPPFTLLSTTGTAIKSDSFGGHILVMEFGSLSSPAFRDRSPAMQHLAQQFAGRVSFLIIYTKEQHPTGGWESSRNEEDGITVDQPAAMGDKMARARDADSRLHFGIPIAVDDMDDTTANAFGGFPNATIVIGPDGKILARQQWTDPTGLPRILDAALAGK